MWSCKENGVTMMQVFAAFTFAALVACALGAPHSSGDAKILGGQKADPGEFPWTVSLRRSSHFCGGSIISRSIVLTASHCVVGLSASQITVVSGSTTLNEGGTFTKVSKIITHPDYNEGESWRNDVAILQLKTPIAFTDSEKPVALPAQDEETGDQEESIVSGWGYTSYPSLLVPNDLQKLNLTLVANDVCGAAFTGNNVYPTNVCAGGISGEGVCNGDSGGPLVAEGKQIGIVSWGHSCATGIPDVYTRVASYADWIAENSVLL